MNPKVIFAVVISCFLGVCLQAQELLEDRNGDGIVTVGIFGDSIAYGRGDTTLPGEFVVISDITDGSRGLLQRVEALAGVNTVNLAIPGEFLSVGGIERYAGTLARSVVDTVIFLEGTNDAGIRIDGDKYQTLVQKVVNITNSLGREIVLATVLPPCCGRLARVPITRGYSREVRTIGSLNNVAVTDLEMAWDTTCDDLEECSLYNIPDGLHPNIPGYDVLGQTVLATLYGINIFAADGAEQLADRLGIDVSEILVQPAPFSQE